jgi:hypothetical protein
MGEKLKYLTTWKDRHGKRRYFFRAHGHKYALPGAPGEVEFHDAYTHYLAELKAKTPGPSRNGIYQWNYRLGD